MSQKDHQNPGSDIPDWKIERFLLNELDETEMGKIRRAAKEDDQLRSRLENLERSNREILNDYSADRMGEQIRAKLRSEEDVTNPLVRLPRFRFARMVLVPAAIVAVVVTAVFVLPDLLPKGDDSGSVVTRIKGQSQQLHLFRKTASGSQQLRDGDRAAEHDLVLLQYQTESGGYGAILSVDGLGTITTHLPGSGSQATELDPRRARFLEFSYELDSAPRWEVFFFVTSPSTFPVDTIVEAIEKVVLVTGSDGRRAPSVNAPEALALPDNFQVSKFTLVKESRHEN